MVWKLTISGRQLEWNWKLHRNCFFFFFFFFLEKLKFSWKNSVNATLTTSRHFTGHVGPRGRRFSHPRNRKSRQRPSGRTREGERIAVFTWQRGRARKSCDVWFILSWKWWTNRVLEWYHYRFTIATGIRCHSRDRSIANRRQATSVSSRSFSKKYPVFRELISPLIILNNVECIILTFTLHVHLSLYTMTLLY